MRHMKQLALSLFLICSFHLSESAIAKDLESATRVARDWIRVIDSERYEQSWQMAAPIFTEHAPLADWSKSAREARAPFGEVKQRELSAAEIKESLPGAPEGLFAIVQFRTKFESNKQAVETVTVMLMQNEWKPSGYFIKPRS